MRYGKTSTGFEFSYDEARVDDMRMADALMSFMDEELPEFSRLKAASSFVELLFGKAGKNALYDHIAKSNEGRVPYVAFYTELGDILKGGTELKNLQASP